MRNCFVLPLFLLVVLFSCKNNPECVVVDKFPSEVSSSPSAKLAFDSVFCSYPRMKIDGELCCVADYATKECFFHIYSYPSFKYVKSLVNKGHSANELEMLTDFCVKDGYIYALCGAQNVVKVFNVNDKNDIKVIRIPKSNGYMSIEINEDGELLCNALDGNKKVHRLNTKGEILDSLVEIPRLELAGSFTPNDMCACVIRCNDDVVAIASKHGDKIEILSGNDSQSLITVNGLNDMPEMCNGTIGSMPYTTIHYSTYVDMCVKKRIYALYCGMDFSAIPPKEMGKSIRVFDLNGNPVKKYNLYANTNYSSIYADENAKKIYLIVPEEEKQIYVYDM